MSVFGTAAGIIALVSLLALLVKYPLRRLGLHKLNAFFMRLHEAASGLFFVSAIAHMFAERRSFKRAPFSALLGLASFVISVVLIADCHMAKDAAKMRRHRIYSLLLTLTAACHAASGCIRMKKI